MPHSRPRTARRLAPLRLRQGSKGPKRTAPPLLLPPFQGPALVCVPPIRLPFHQETYAGHYDSDLVEWYQTCTAIVPAKTRSACRAQRSQLNSAARAKPLCVRRSLTSYFAIARRMISAISSTERGSKYSNTPPETSGMQELFDATVGTPQAIASTIGKQNPS